jgi:hypothetical protein
MAVDEFATVVEPLRVDGKPMASLIALERRETSSRLFPDRDFYKLEPPWPFGPAWNLTHELDIPECRDFVASASQTTPYWRVRPRGRDPTVT